MVGVEQLELSSPWSKLPEQHPASFNSSFSTFSSSFSFFLPKAVKFKGFTGETEPSRGKERLGRECLRLMRKLVKKIAHFWDAFGIFWDMVESFWQIIHLVTVCSGPKIDVSMCFRSSNLDSML